MSERTWVSYNINEYVRVKLSAQALDLYRQRAEQLRAAYPSMPEMWPDAPALDADGYWRAQMYVVMRLIGPLCNAGQSALEHCEMQMDASKLRPFNYIFNERDGSWHPSEYRPADDCPTWTKKEAESE